MAGNECLNGCAGDSAKIFSTNYNNGITGERKISSSGSTMPPLPEPVPMRSVSTPGKEIQAPQDTSFQVPRQFLDSRQDAAVVYQPEVLKEGCYYIHLMPISLHTPSRFQYEGTMRIQRTGSTIIASGDLYYKDFCQTPTFCPALSNNNDRENSIPAFPCKQYAYYLRITQIQENIEPGKPIIMELELFRFERSNHTWNQGETLTAELKFSTGPDGIHYWQGDIFTRAQIVLGRIEAVWISPYLRQAVIELDRVAASRCPTDDDKGSTWQSVFKKAGWNITVDISDADVDEPEDQSWSNAELHQKMLEYRQKVDLDKQWRYHLLAVRNLDDKAFGLMYDNTVKGINDIPREGGAIASHVLFPDEDCWGKCKGKHFGECQEPYIRTAIHEIGHAMMLYHPDNPYENYIMQKTVHIAHNAVPPKKFPENIEWSFSPRDIRLLCHLPDIAVRPGGVSFGTPHDRLPVNARDEVVEADGLELKVEALCDVVPIGAPVRVNFTLINRSQEKKLVPGSLRMKSGHVSGKVVDPLGAAQDFATILHYTIRKTSDVMPQELPPGESISHSATLLWGTEGPLFPTSGYYRIILELNWHLEGVRIRIAGSAGVMVTPPKDDEHARAALKIFSTPDTILALAVGGDHIEAGNEVIRMAINHPVLKPHYDLVEAKRVGQRFFKRKPNLKETFEMVDEGTVMSPAEVLRFTKILRDFAGETEKEVVEKMSMLLLSKAKGTTVEDMVGNIIKEIPE
jgi:hypothetical protein